jgi:hypothetical protein
MKIMMNIMSKLQEIDIIHVTQVKRDKKGGHTPTPPRISGFTNKLPESGVETSDKSLFVTIQGGEGE